MTKEEIRRNVTRIALSNTADQIRSTLRYYERTLSDLVDDNCNDDTFEYYNEKIQQHREALDLRVEKESRNV